MLKDFRAFLMRGNVVDLAVAVVIGAAFGAIVTSFVKDILMPPIGLVLGIDRLHARPLPPSPSTKECPQCAMVIPVRAVRCPHCTSNVGGPEMAPHTPQRS